jgi:hypothetical protein
MNLTLHRLKKTRTEKADKDVMKVLADFPLAVLAGGAFKELLRGEAPSDYDIFLLNGCDVEALKSRLETDGFTKIFTCPRGELFTYAKEKVKVQIVLKRRYVDVLDLLNSFDFSICYFALHDGALHTSKQAIKDWRKKTLSLVRLTYPSSTINRLYKYRKRGYYTGAVIKEIVMRVNAMADYDPTNDELYVD